MSKRSMMIALLGLSLVVMLGAEANALSISGWGVSCCSAVDVEVDLRGVPNTVTNPSIVRVTATLEEIEIVCRNPKDNTQPASQGNAGTRTVSNVNQVGPQEVFGHGQAEVHILFDLTFAEDRHDCVNPNWSVIPNSAAVSEVLATIEVFKCTGDPKTDPDPCFDGTTLTGVLTNSVTTRCTLDPVLRNSDFTVQHNQEFICGPL